MTQPDATVGDTFDKALARLNDSIEMCEKYGFSEPISSGPDEVERAGTLLIRDIRAVLALRTADVQRAWEGRMLTRPGVKELDGTTLANMRTAFGEAFKIAAPSETRDSTPWESLKYLHISTARDGQWADQAVHSFVGSLLARHEDDMASVSARASMDEGYPGIAHDLETLRTALLAFCEAFSNRGETTSLQQWNERLKSAYANAQEVLAGRLPYAEPK